MAPPLLKKMSGSRERVEGNYASWDLFPLLGTSLNSDLGLTLLPGSQARRGYEECSNSVTRFGVVNHVGHDGQQQTAEQTRDHHNVCGSGNSENEAPIYSTTALIRTEPHGLANVPNEAFRDGIQTQCDDRSPRAPKWRKLERQGPHQSSDVTGHESLSTFTASQRRDGSTSIADADHVQLDRAQGSALVLSVRRLSSVNEAEVFENLLQTSPSGSTSVLESRKFGISPADSPQHFIPRAPQKIAQPPKTLNNHFHIPDTSVSEELKLQDSDFHISPAVLKPLVKIVRSKDSRFTVHGQYRPADTPTKAFLQQRSKRSRSTSNATTSLRRAVLKSVTKATRSWTSHFPEASIRLHARSDKAPATFPAAAASLPPTAEHQHTPIANSASTTTRNQQKPTASGRNQSQASLNNTLLPARVSGSRSSNLSTHRLRNTTTAEHQQHPPHYRSSSLPDLPLRHRMSAMDPIHGYELSALPTPPNEKQSLSFQRPNSLSSPTAASKIWDHADNGAFDGLNPFTTSSTSICEGEHHAGNYPYNHSTHQNTYSPTNTMAYHSGSAQYQHSPPGCGFGLPSSQALFLNGSMTLALQHFNGQIMQPKAYYSHAEIQDLLNGWHQHLEARSRRSDAAHQSQLSQEKSQSQNLLHENARLGSESKLLKLNLGKVQQERDFLSGRVQFHEHGEMFQRFQSMSNTLAYQHQEMAFLRHENERLNKANNQLISEMERLAAQSRPNAAVAKNILQTLSFAVPSAPLSGYDKRGSTVSESNTVTIPTSRPFQGSSSQEDNAGTTSLHQNHVQSRCFSGQPETQVTTFPTRLVDPQALSGAVNHITSSFPTSSVEPPLIARQSCPAPHAHSNFAGNGDNIEDISPQHVLIDLTDDLPHSSSESVTALVPQTHLPFAHDKSETERITEDLKAQTAIRAAFNKKELNWIDGLHPGRAIHTPGVNFGLPSSKEALAARAKEAPSKNANINAKKTKDVTDAVASLSDAQKEQPRNDSDENRRATSAAHQRTYREKERREQGKLSFQTPIAPVSALQVQKQGRKSAKVQKRQQAARLAEVRHPVAQYTLDERTPQGHIEHPPPSLIHAGAQQSGADSDPLIDGDDDDMEVMYFPDDTANEDQAEEMTPAQFREMIAAEAEIDTRFEDGAAKLEAMLTADADAGADSDDGGAAELEAMMEAEARELEAAENGPEDSSAAVTSADTDGPAYHDDESEVSEEE